MNAQRHSVLLVAAAIVLVAALPAQGGNEATGHYPIFLKDGRVLHSTFRPTAAGTLLIWGPPSGRVWDLRLDQVELERSKRAWREMSSRGKLDTHPLQGGSFPRISFLDVAERAHHLPNKQAPFTLVYFWSTSCAPCRRDLHMLREWQAKHKECESIQVVALCAGLDRKAWQKALDDLKLRGLPRWVHSYNTYAHWAAEGRLLPGGANESFLIDSSGRILHSRLGGTVLLPALDTVCQNPHAGHPSETNERGK